MATKLGLPFVGISDWVNLVADWYSSHFQLELTFSSHSGIELFDSQPWISWHCWVWSEVHRDCRHPRTGQRWSSAASTMAIQTTFGLGWMDPRALMMLPQPPPYLLGDIIRYHGDSSTHFYQLSYLGQHATFLSQELGISYSPPENVIV
jgi:hypothetical protein